MTQYILIFSIIATLCIFINTYRTCTEEDLNICLHSKIVILEDVNEVIHYSRILLEVFLDNV